MQYAAGEYAASDACSANHAHTSFISGKHHLIGRVVVEVLLGAARAREHEPTHLAFGGVGSVRKRCEIDGRDAGEQIGCGSADVLTEPVKSGGRPEGVGAQAPAVHRDAGAGALRSHLARAGEAFGVRPEEARAGIWDRVALRASGR